MVGYVYIIESEKDQSYYIGSTRDLQKRLKEHNSGFSKYTSQKIPWKLRYYEIFLTMKEAMSREAFLKKQRNREFYNKLIKGFETNNKL